MNRHRVLKPLIEKYGMMTEFNNIHTWYLERMAGEDFKDRGEMVRFVNNLSEKMYG